MLGRLTKPGSTMESLNSCCGRNGVPFARTDVFSVAVIPLLANPAALADAAPEKFASFGATLLTASSLLLTGGLIAALLLQRRHRRKSAAIYLAQNRILENIASGAPMMETLARLAQSIEAQSPGMICTIALLDKDGVHVRPGASPSLPESYAKAINGIEIGPRAGSCGTAMYRKQPVIVQDIQTDPLWEDFRPLAASLGLRACWSAPIFSHAGRVLGSFAIYHRHPKAPGAAELRLSEIACHLASIAMDQAQARQTLQESEQRFRSAMENLNEGLLITDLKGRMLDVNPQMQELSGYRREEMLGQYSFDLLAPDKREEMLRRIEQRQIGQSESYELKLRRKDGSRLWVMVNASPLRDAGGQVIGTVGAISDISQRKLAEDALRREEERFRLVSLATQDAIYDWDIHSGAVWRNETYLALLNAGEPINPTHDWWRERIHPDDRKRVLAAHEQALRERNFFLAIEYQLRKSNGSYAAVLDRGYFLYDAGGHPFRKLGAMTDITERKHAEAELFKSRQMLRTVIDTIPQRVFWKDRRSVYVGCNQALAEDYGLSDPSELIGKTDYAIKSAEAAARYQADDQLVMNGNQPRINYEEAQARAGGGKGWLRTSKVPLHDKEGNVIGVLGTYEDITDRKQLEEQLRQSQKMEAFGQLAGGVAHDFNNLLTIIQGNIALLQSEIPDRSEEADALLEITRAAERAANLTRQLLTFSRRQLFQPRPLDLNEAVAHTTTMLQRLIGEHIALETRFAPGPAPVAADRNMMEQILVNLAVNARDAMPRGGKLAIATAVHEVSPAEAQANPKRRAGAFVQLSITDTGCGIAPEQMVHIFEPFYTTKDVGKGTGLGLATVFGIVTQHQGWIEVESRVNHGTTFCIYLPCLTENSKVLAEFAQPSEVRGGTETILIVEDEAPVRVLSRKVLEREGYQVIEADSGPSALQLWQTHRHQVDLLLTDMVMPGGLSGYELAEQLRADKPGLKVIYNSGYTDDMLGDNSPLRDNPNFMEKPFAPQKLLQQVRNCLDGVTIG